MAALRDLRSAFGGSGIGVALVLTVLVATAPLVARADDRQGPYRVRWVEDLGITGIAAVTWVVPMLLVDDLVTPSCPCDTREVNALDRSVAGVNRSAPALASDIAIGSLYPLGFALDALDVNGSDAVFMGWLKDAAVMAQALALNGALTQLVKVAAGRPRPFLYGQAAGSPATRDPGNYTSFYSGHTSNAFTLGLSYAQTYAYRHPQSPYRYVVFASAIALGSAVATLRVVSGKHFPTDVLAGAGAGALIGLGVPWLHRRAPATTLGLAPMPTGAMLLLTHASP